MKTHHLAIAKRILLFSAIYFFCILNTSAQLKHFLPDSNAYFSVATLKYWFEGDTTINKLRYKKVYIQMDAEIPNFENAEYFAAVREDTIAEKIYSLQKTCPKNN